MADFPLNIDINTDVSAVNKLFSDIKNGSKEAVDELNRILSASVTKKVTLESVFDDKGVRQVIAAERESLGAASEVLAKKKALEAIEENSVTRLRQQVNEAKKVRDGISRYETTLDGVGNKILVANQRWIEQNDKVRNIQRSLAQADDSGFWKRLKGDTGIGGLIDAFNGITQLANGFQSLSIIVGQITASINTLTDALAGLQSFGLAFVAIGQGASGAQQALLESSRIALNLGVSLQGVRTSFQQLSPVILNTGGSINDVSKITEALSSRFAAFGISGDRARRVTNGIIQAFGKGKLQAEELTQQIGEADPAFGTDFAKALGVSTSRLLELVKAGKITTDVLVQNIPKLSKTSLVYGKLGVSAVDAASALSKSSNQVGTGFADVGPTIDQVRNKIASLNQLSLERIAKVFEPLLFALIKIQAVLSDFFAKLSQSAAVEALARVIGGVGNAIAVLLQGLANIASPLLSVINALASFLNVLLKIEPVATVLGFAIGGKLLQSLGLLQTGFTKAALGGGAFGQLVSKIKAPFQDLFQAGSGLGKVNSAIQQTADTASGSILKQAKSLDVLSKASNFTSGNISRLRKESEALKQEIAQLQEKSAATKGAGPLGPGPQIGSSIKAKERELAQKQKELDKQQTIAGRVEEKQRTTQQAVSQTRTARARTATEIGTKISADPKTVENIATRYSKASQALGTFTKINNDANSGLKKSQTILQENSAKMADLNDRFKKGTISAADYISSRKEISKSTAKANADIANFGNIANYSSSRITALGGTLNSLSTRAAASGTIFGKVGRAAGGFASVIGSSAVTAVKGLGGAIKGLATSLGRVGAILLAVGVVQSMFATATAKAQEEIDKTAASTKVYSEIIGRLSTKKPEPPKLGGFEKVWLSLSLRVADAFDFIKEKFDQLVETIVNGLKTFPFLARILGIVGNSGVVGATGLGVLADAADDTSLRIRKLARDSKEAINGITTDSKNIVLATNALREFAASKEGKTTEGKLKVATEYKNVKDQVQQTKDTVTDLTNQFNEAQAELNKNKGSKEAKKKLAEVTDKLNKAKNAFAAAQEGLIQFGIQMNLESTSSFVAMATSLGVLNQKLEESKKLLEAAPAGSEAFNATAAIIAATENAIEELNKAAKDPINIKIGIDIRRRELETKLNEIQAKIKEAEKTPITQRSKEQKINLQNLREDAGKIITDLQNLNKLKIKINADSIDNINNKIKDLETKVTEIDINSPQLPKLINDLTIAQDKLNILNAKKNIVEVKIIQRGIELGLLSNSLENVNKQVKLLEDSLQNLDINSPQFKEAVAELQLAKESLENLNFQKAQIEIELIEKGIQEGSIIETTNKLKEKLDLINGQITRVSVESPELPKLVSKLVETEEKINNLNGRVAAVTVRVIEERLQGGQPLTQSLADTRIAAQQAVIKATPTTAPNYSQELEKLKGFERQKEALALTNEELQQKIDKNIRDTQKANSDANIEDLKAESDAIVEGYETEKKNLQEMSTLADEASEKKKRNIELEISKTDEMYERQKQGLQEIASIVQAQHDQNLRNLDAEWARRKKYFDEERKRIEEGTLAQQAKDKFKQQQEKTQLQQTAAGLPAITIGETGKRKRSGKPTPEEQQKAKDQLAEIDKKEKLAELDKKQQQEEQNYQQNRQAIESKMNSDAEANKKKQMDLEKEQQAKKQAGDKEIADIEEKDRQRKEEEKKKEQELEKKTAEEKKKIKEEERKQEEIDRQARKKEREEEQKERDKQLAALQAELKSRQQGRDVTKERQEITDQESKTFAESLAPTIKNIAETVETVFKPAMEQASASAEKVLKPSLEPSAAAAKTIANEIKSLDGKTITVYVKQVALAPGRWAGGPVDAGQQYQVNEIGKEGFLSSTGRLTPINKPRNGLWTAPTSGTVIPANIWEKLDVPSSGVKVTNKPTTSIRGKESDLAKIANQIQASLAAQSNDELAAVQAQQAIEIGKLSRAVDRLADKKWNVQVGVTSTSNSAYLRTLNNMM